MIGSEAKASPASPNEAMRPQLVEEAGSDRTGATPHTDERQVHLDTERSFVIYPQRE